jgi:hypothetical protein
MSAEPSVDSIASMRLHRPLVTAILIATVAASSAARGASQPPLDPCPRPLTMRPVFNVERVVDGFFASLQRVRPDINYGQGRTTPVTRATTQIREVIALNRKTKDALAFRRLASRSCGATIAGGSWAVVANFPLAPMASTGQVAFFLVFTTRGWKLYGGVLDYD